MIRLDLTHGEAVALAALLSLSHTPLAVRLTAWLDQQITATRPEREEES